MTPASFRDQPPASQKVDIHFHLNCKVGATHVDVQLSVRRESSPSLAGMQGSAFPPWVRGVRTDSLPNKEQAKNSNHSHFEEAGEWVLESPHHLRCETLS